MDAKIAPVGSDARLPTAGRVAVSAPRNDQSGQAPADAKSDISTAEPAPKMLIKIDKDSGRFVNTLVDADGAEVIRQYPSEAQLAYSRAVTAYLRALSIK